MWNVQQENLYRHVDFLTSIRPYRNYKNIESLNKAADYIERELKNSGLKTSVQTWEMQGNTYKNITASYRPKKEKRLVIGAHYDVYKEQPGADDNASSVAGLLEIANYAGKTEPQSDYGIDFIAFSLEEPPVFKTKYMGSYMHAKTVYEARQNIVGMIALEMIGYFSGKEEKENAFDFYKKELIVSGIKKYDDFNKKIVRLLKKRGKLNSRRLSFADNYKNNGPSDHRNYWQFGYPAVMVIGSGGNGNPHYHKKSDTIESLNFKVMAEAVNCIALAVFNFQ